MRALALFSGGLDSVLAMKTIIDQNIEVIAVYIDTGFGGRSSKQAHLENLCRQIGAKLEILDVKQAYIDEVLFTPQYGYGKNFNPCIDCHGFMFKCTSKLLEKYEASFIISGEVLGQRPMSQNSDALKTVQKISEVDDLILRPLSAKLLAPSKPEIQGWVDREKLLDISGRCRSRQLAMAKDIGLENYEIPAGGCILTEIAFSDILKDFSKYEKLEIEDIDALKFGRHFRLPDEAKLIVGRNEEDNKKLENTNSKKFLKARIFEGIGPMALISRNATQNDRELAANMIATYGKTNFDENYQIMFYEDENNPTFTTGKKVASRNEFQKFLVVQI